MCLPPSGRTTVRGDEAGLGLPPQAARTEDPPRTRPLHSPEGAMPLQVVHTGTKAGSQGNPSQLEDCHQSKQVILSKARQLADQQVCAPGRTRTCNLRIRSRTAPVCLVMPWAIAAGPVGSAVRPVASRPAP